MNLYIGIGYILPTIRRYMSIGEFLCALWAQGCGIFSKNIHILNSFAQRAHRHPPIDIYPPFLGNRYENETLQELWMLSPSIFISFDYKMIGRFYIVNFWATKVDFRIYYFYWVVSVLLLSLLLSVVLVGCDSGWPQICPRYNGKFQVTLWISKIC